MSQVAFNPSKTLEDSEGMCFYTLTHVPVGPAHSMRKAWTLAPCLDRKTIMTSFIDWFVLGKQMSSLVFLNVFDSLRQPQRLQKNPCSFCSKSELFLGWHFT